MLVQKLSASNLTKSQILSRKESYALDAEYLKFECSGAISNRQLAIYKPKVSIWREVKAGLFSATVI